MKPATYPTPDQQSLDTPADAWTVVMGNGFRGDVEQLTARDAAHLKERFIKRFADDKILAIKTNGLHAIAWNKGTTF